MLNKTCKNPTEITVWLTHSAPITVWQIICVVIGITEGRRLGIMLSCMQIAHKLWMSQSQPWGGARTVPMPTILGEYDQIKVRPMNCKGYRYICSSESFEEVRIQIVRPQTLGHRCGRGGQLPLIVRLRPGVPSTAGSSAAACSNVLQG